MLLLLPLKAISLLSPRQGLGLGLWWWKRLQTMQMRIERFAFGNAAVFLPSRRGASPPLGPSASSSQPFTIHRQWGPRHSDLHYLPDESSSTGHVALICVFGKGAKTQGGPEKWRRNLDSCFSVRNVICYCTTKKGLSEVRQRSLPRVYTLST